MAVDRIIHPEFRDQFGGTKYPFGDAASLRSRDQFVLDKKAVVDAVIYVANSEGSYYIESVENETIQSRIWIGDSTRKRVAYGDYLFESADEVIDLFSTLGAVCGMIVIDPIEFLAIRSWGEGNHSFDPNATQFVPSVGVSLPGIGLQGFVVNGEVVSGDVHIVCESGIVGSVTSQQTLRFDVVGDPLFRRRLCSEAELFATPRLVRKILVNNTIEVTPDDLGRTFIVASGATSNSILRILPTQQGIHVEMIGQKAGEK